MSSMTRLRHTALQCLGLTLLLICGGLSAPSTARAGLVFRATPSQAIPGSSGWFDIVLLNDSDLTGPTYQVGGFSAEVSVAADSGVTFTGATEDTDDQYIFSNNLSPPTLASSMADAGISVTDLSQVSPYYRDLAPGETVGIARILYTLDASGPLSQIAVMFDAEGTTVSGADGITALPISELADGTITAIPEIDPAVGGSALALAVAVLAMIERRRSVQVSVRGA